METPLTVCEEASSRWEEKVVVFLSKKKSGVFDWKTFCTLTFSLPGVKATLPLDAVPVPLTLAPLSSLRPSTHFLPHLFCPHNGLTLQKPTSQALSLYALACPPGFSYPYVLLSLQKAPH